MTKTAERWGRVRDRFGRSYVGRISQHRIINFSIRRTGSRGTFDGVIGLSAFDYIDRFYTNLTNPGPGTLIALVRDDGELLAGNDVARGSGVPSALRAWRQKEIRRSTASREESMVSIFSSAK